RRKKGSSNWYKQKIKVARIHEKIANARNDYLHKTSTNIVKNHDVIGMEDLQVSNMLKNRNLAKSISEVSWAHFCAMLEYKAKWYGKKVIKVAKNFLPVSFVLVVATKIKTLKILDYVNGNAQSAINTMIGILTQVSIFVMKQYD